LRDRRRGGSYADRRRGRGTAFRGGMRIVTGATDSSAEGDRTDSRTPLIFCARFEKASHRGPRTAATDRTAFGADLEALVAVEAQDRAVQRQMERPRRVSWAQQLHANETLWTARWLRDDEPIVRSARAPWRAQAAPRWRGLLSPTRRYFAAFRRISTAEDRVHWGSRAWISSCRTSR
jgi:hypothetical protein